MILQKLQFCENGESQREMYYRWYPVCGVAAVGGVQDFANKTISISQGWELNTNTYFNAFSIEKWTYYTNIKEIAVTMKLKGVWEICLTRWEFNPNGGVSEYILNCLSFKSDKPDDITINYPVGPAKGLLAFKVRALEDSVFYGGAYISNVDENILPAVNLALCICTYKREDFVCKNVKMLNENVFEKEDSWLKNHLAVYIADNGKTLGPYSLDSDNIKVFPNLNSGGAGGFTRGMIEAIVEKDKRNLTHFILMDDDVVFTNYALERLYVFLRLLKPEYKNSHIGGAMLKLHSPSIQHAAGETFDTRNVFFNKENYNMFLIEDILKTELIESINQLAWWFFCFPISDNADKDLALPIFFQYDDFDYNLRHRDYEKITTIGICLWHEAFEKKASTFKNYYTMRNRLIIGSLHGNASFNKRYVKQLLIYHVAQNIWLYRYKEAHLWLRAVEDYLRGFEWLVSQNPEQLNIEIMKSADQMVPVRKLPFNFVYKNFRHNKDYAETKWQRFIRRITFNGWFSFSKGEVIVAANNPNKSFVAYKKRVLNYDLDTQKGFVTQKDWKEFFQILRKLFKVLHRVNQNYYTAVAKYREDYSKYISEDFWHEYLGVEM